MTLETVGGSRVIFCDLQCFPKENLLYIKSIIKKEINNV